MYLLNRKASTTIFLMKMKFRIASFLITFLLSSGAMAVSSSYEQKNLRGRMGVGFTNQIATTADGTIPALSAKYYMSKSFAASLGFGFDTRSNPGSTMAVGMKLYKNVFFEPQMIFYTGGGVGLVSKNGTKTQFSLFVGSEFFLAGLPSLGLSFEAGIRGDNTSGSFALRSIGDSFLTGGMHFYF